MTDVHTDGDRAKVCEMIPGVDNGTGVVPVTVASVDKIPMYGFSEVSPITNEEAGTDGVAGPKLGPSKGETSPNRDLEEEGEPPAGRVGGVDSNALT